MYKTTIMPVNVFKIALNDKAVRYVEFLARQDGVVHLLHVLPDSVSSTTNRFAADLRRFEEYLQHEAEARLQTIVSHFSADPSCIKLYARFSGVRDMVNELASEINTDVVVISSRSPSVNTHLLGSNASNVICHAHIPMTVVR